MRPLGRLHFPPRLGASSATPDRPSSPQRQPGRDPRFTESEQGNISYGCGKVRVDGVECGAAGACSLETPPHQPVPRASRSKTNRRKTVHALLFRKRGGGHGLTSQWERRALELPLDSVPDTVGFPSRQQLDPCHLRAGSLCSTSCDREGLPTMHVLGTRRQTRQLTGRASLVRREIVGGRSSPSH